MRKKDSGTEERFDVLHLITGRPQGLLLVSTGNISNDELERIVRGHVDEIVEAFTSAAYVELGRESLTVHE